MIDRDLYVFKEDLYRAGNTISPRLTNVRPFDVEIFQTSNGTHVRSNNKGVSVFTKEEIIRKGLKGDIWRIPAGTALPSGLKLYNDYGGHYFICPVYNMALSAYKRLLEDLNLKGVWAWRTKKKKNEGRE